MSEEPRVTGQSEAPRPGFWIRASGRCADLALLAVFQLVLFGLACLVLARPGTPGLLLPILGACTPVFWGLYLAVCTARSGQTVGKLLVGLRVTGPGGRDVSAGQAVTRAVADAGATVLSGLCLVGLLDYLWVAFSRQRRALHDMVAGTEVRHVRFVRRGWSVAVGLAGVLLFAATLRMAQTHIAPVGPHMSDSMAPTIRVGDQMYGDGLTYRLRPPRHGDIVRFMAPPQADPAPRPKDFVKRIVGLPGDRVAVHDGKLWRNGAAVDKPYLMEPMVYTWPEGGGTVLVPPGNAVVLGDNRNDSYDSHAWCTYTGEKAQPAPFLPLANIRAQVVAIGWPPGRIRDLNDH